MSGNGSFAGERFLDTVPPSYEFQRVLVTLAVAVVTAFWVGCTLSFRKRAGALFDTINVTMRFLIVATILVVFANPHNNFALRRVFEVPVLTRPECNHLLTIAEQTATRNADLRGNETAELLDAPVGWYKSRDPIYPTTDLHILLDPFTADDRRYLRDLSLIHI